MQVTSITCSMGFTVNMGDYQNVKCELAMRADLDRNEDEDEAAAKLRGKVIANLIAMGADAHPDRVKGLLGGKVQPALPAPATEPKKRGPKPKTTEATQTFAEDVNIGEELGDSIPLNGAGTAEATLGEDDGEDLLGGGELEITQEILIEKMREILKVKQKAGLLELLRKVGATNLKTIPLDKYQELYALACKTLAN